MSAEDTLYEMYDAADDIIVMTLSAILKVADEAFGSDGVIDKDVFKTIIDLATNGYSACMTQESAKNYGYEPPE